jgi:hypothetical protein
LSAIALVDAQAPSAGHLIAVIGSLFGGTGGSILFGAIAYATLYVPAATAASLALMYLVYRLQPKDKQQQLTNHF